MSLTGRIVTQFHRDPLASSAEIAEYIGCSSAAVRAALQRRGLRLARRQGGAWDNRDTLQAKTPVRRSLIKAAGT